MEEKRINEIIRLDKKRFSNKKYFNFALSEIKRHLPLLKKLKENKSSKLKSELIDVYVWSRILLKTHKINNKDINKRISYFKEKLKKR